jgi:hypothetical protein
VEASKSRRLVKVCADEVIAVATQKKTMAVVVLQLSFAIMVSPVELEQFRAGGLRRKE